VSTKLLLMADNTKERSSSPENDPLSLTEDYVPVRENKTPGTATISFQGLLDPPLLLHEDLKEGCGGQLWPAGIVLAKYMLHYHRDDLGQKTM
jgi:protein N-lysine methyltransferase METTL21A